jgi:hypothetical protein
VKQAHVLRCLAIDPANIVGRTFCFGAAPDKNSCDGGLIIGGARAPDMLCFVGSAGAGRRRDGIPAMRKSIVLGLAAALAVLGSAAANAEVRISGTADNMVLRTEGATLGDVLAGLAATSHARIEVAGATSQQFTGIYSGSLREVLSRLLAHVDHVVRIAPDRITIVVVGPGAPGGSASVSVAAAEDGDGGSGVQGWNPSGPLPGASDAAQTHPVPRAAAADDKEATSGVQGWVPAQIAALTQPAPAGAAAPASSAPQALLIAANGSGADGSVQGWVPTAESANRR